VDSDTSTTDGAGAELAGLFYALVALEQPLTLGELAEGAATRGFPALATRTPEWFAAAASGSDLLAMAPELQALPPEEEPDDARAGSSSMDLIHVYAPEMAMLDDLDDEEEIEVDGPVVVESPAASPAAGRQIGLLRELDGLDD